MSGKEVTLRPWRAEDVDGVDALEQRVYPSPWLRYHFVEVLDLPLGMGTVAVTPDGTVVGYAIGWVVTDEAELANIAVAPEWRRERLGSRLLEAVIEEARRRGAARLWLEVRESNAGARAFYARHGFGERGLRRDYYDEPTEDAIVMSLELETPRAGPRRGRHRPVDPSGADG